MLRIDVALMEKPVDDGLTMKEIMKLLSIINGDEVYLIEVEQENGTSSAMGFVSVDAANKNSFSEEMLKAEVAKVLNNAEFSYEYTIFKVNEEARVILFR